MNVSVISFTRQGSVLEKKIYSCLKAEGIETEAYTLKKFCDDETLLPLTGKLEDWTREKFSKDALIFVGASGIAVRSIAPYIKDKRDDPAVIVIDELGKFIIPLLSGHIGGANELALMLAEWTGGVPVVTTATDVNGKFAVDVFAKKNNLYITDMKTAKLISAEILEGKNIGLFCEGDIKGDIPSYLKQEKDSCKTGIVVTEKTNLRPYEQTLHLVPKCLSLGIGCRRGIEFQKIEEKVLRVLKENSISIHGILNAASIDLKKLEPGILTFCEKYNLPVSFYNKEELVEVPGNFTDSGFVKSITGVDNVCERAAVRASGEGSLIIKKYAQDGITIAVAKKEWCVEIE